MKVGIFINSTKEEANAVANQFGSLLRENDIESKIVNLIEDCKDIDLIVVFGGDGTILRVVEYAIEYNLPILAINVRSIGFLSCLEENQLDEAIRLIKSENDFEKRTILKIVVDGQKYHALNEVIVQRKTEGSSLNEVVKLSLEIDGQLVNKYKADGLIISTPTGSTAYSLSAGGAIITPDVNAFIATPVCPHSLHNKPVVYSDTKQARITALENSQKCAVYVDGKYVKSLAPGSSIFVSKSKYQVKFFKTKDNFFNKLLVKLSTWGKVDEQ